MIIAEILCGQPPYFSSEIISEQNKMEVDQREQQQEQLFHKAKDHKKDNKKLQIETFEPSFSTRHKIILAVVVTAIITLSICYQITIREKGQQQSIRIETPSIGEQPASLPQGSSQNIGDNGLNPNVDMNQQMGAQIEKKQTETQKKFAFESDPKNQQQFLIHPTKDAKQSREDHKVLSEISQQLIMLKNFKDRGEGAYRKEKSSPKTTNKQEQQQYKQYLKKITENPQKNDKSKQGQQVNEKQPPKQKQNQLPKQKEISSIQKPQQTKKHIKQRMESEEEPENELQDKIQQQKKIQQMKKKLQHEKKEKSLKNKQQELNWKEQMKKKKAKQQQRKIGKQQPDRLAKTQLLGKDLQQNKKQKQEQGLKKKVQLQMERQRQQRRKKQQEYDREGQQYLNKKKKMAQQQKIKQQQQKRKEQQQNKKHLTQQKRMKQQAQRQKLKQIQQQRVKQQQQKRKESQKENKDPQQLQLQKRKLQFQLQKQKRKAQEARKKVDLQKNKNSLSGNQLKDLPKKQQALKQQPPMPDRFEKKQLLGKDLQQENKKKEQDKKLAQQQKIKQQQQKRKEQQRTKKHLTQQQRMKQQAQRQKLKQIQQQRVKQQQQKRKESQKKSKDPQQLQLQKRKLQFQLQKQKRKAQEARKKVDLQKNKNLLQQNQLKDLPKKQQALKQLPPIQWQPNSIPKDEKMQLQIQLPKQTFEQKNQKDSNHQQIQKMHEKQKKKQQIFNKQPSLIQERKLEQVELRKEDELIARLKQMQQKRQIRQVQKQKLLQMFDKYNEQNDKKTPKMSPITPSTENRFRIDMAELYGIPEYIVPKFVWTYVDDVEKQSLFVRRCLENMRHFARLSLFQLSVINGSNFKTHLPHATVLRVEETLSKLQQRMRTEPQSNLKDHFENIRRRLIIFHVLNERGGIFVEPNVLFTENFDWLKAINKNRYANVGSINARAQYVGFSDIDHGTPYEKHNKIGVVYETEKYMIEFPSFEPYFLAAVAKGEFLTQVLDEYSELLHQPQTLSEKLRKYDVKMGAIFGKDINYEIFYISQHIVLRRKQMEISANNGNLKNNIFAIDHYGFFTINERYFPKKLQFTFQNNLKQKIYRNLAKYTLEQLQQTVGPLSYIVCMMFEDHINFMLEDIKKRKAVEEIHPQSFLSKFVLRNRSQPFIQKQLEVNNADINGKIWQNLPKIIWLFWDTGFNYSGINNKLCIDNIRRNTQLSQFEIRELNNSNIEQYLGNELNTKINKFIQNKKITTFAQTKSDFVRIAIIAKYGGIYMDASYFAVENLEWIINIAKYPSQYVFNRYGELPSVLMLFHPHFGQPFQWKFDREANTKHMWLSAYESNLLIAEPNQQIFWDWFEEHTRFITSNYDQSQKIMKQYDVYGDRWTSSGNTYLAVMDSIKNVIGKKQKQIRQLMKNADYKGPKSAAQFYRIWSMSGYRGQQKFRAHTNFDNTYNSKPFNSDNVFLWRYSQQYVSGIVGKVNHLVKLYGKNIQYLNEVLQKSYDSNFKSQFHPHSVFMKYLYNSSIHKINRINGKLELEYLKK